jgi:L-amino acid N-acyltransferase YncA
MSQKPYLRKLEPTDWQQVVEIYLAGVAGGNATFETQAPGWEQWDSAHFNVARFVAVDDLGIHGWAALSPVSTRHAYRGVAEVSVYVSTEFQGKGVGRQLLEALITESERHDIWMLQASIFSENSASLKLHTACGFREVGYRERIAKLKDTWRSTTLLERRSTIVGVD